MIDRELRNQYEAIAERISRMDSLRSKRDTHCQSPTREFFARKCRKTRGSKP